MSFAKCRPICLDLNVLRQATDRIAPTPFEIERRGVTWINRLFCCWEKLECADWMRRRSVHISERGHPGIDFVAAWIPRS